jgi:hypothetical protein
MIHLHIPGDRRELACVLKVAGKRVPSVRMFSLFLLVASLLATAACVGVTGSKLTTGGPGNGENTLSAIVTPSSADFGKVPIHTNVTRLFTLTNTGTTNLTVTRLDGAGLGYSTGGGGLSVNTVVKAGASLKFYVLFTPTAAGNVPGNLRITTTADSAPLVVALNGTGVEVPAETPIIGVTPSSANFGNVPVGTIDTQTLRLGNSGKADLVITKISVSGKVFGASGLSIPQTIPAGETETFTASFKPIGPGADTGSIAIFSNASESPLSLALTGSGAASNSQLSVSRTSVNFGTVRMGSTSTQDVVLKNTGNSNVTISSVATAGTGFTVTGGVDVILMPGQSINVAIGFDPKGARDVTGTLTISSNAPTLQIALSGQGATADAAQHSASLDWAPSTSVVVGYNVYRGSVSGGPYSRLNSAVESVTSYKDESVSSGQKYYYVVTSVDDVGIESAFSNQVSATIPGP